jgi:hypothetical protein
MAAHLLQAGFPYAIKADFGEANCSLTVEWAWDSLSYGCGDFYGTATGEFEIIAAGEKLPLLIIGINSYSGSCTAPATPSYWGKLYIDDVLVLELAHVDLYDSVNDAFFTFEFTPCELMALYLDASA